MTLRGPKDKVRGFEPRDAGSIPAGGTKVCSKCKEDRDLEQFASKNGKPQSICRACTKISSDAHYQRNKDKVKARTKERTRIAKKKAREFVWQYLLVHPCGCGEADPILLDFDHLGDKRKGISQMIAGGCNIQRLEEEIAKCQILCVVCHRRKTASDGNWWRCHW